MIIAWILSIIFSFSGLIFYLERMNALELIHLNTQAQTQEHFIQAEKIVLACQFDLLLGTHLDHPDCDFYFLENNYWLISNLNKPQIEVLVFFDSELGMVKRLNWRQVFD
ncbi:hypothetical protein G6656_05955 [Polynucleobacter paneuropaeus]|uniref:hypothetical protein n=1 Tax=Polynucleobacter paludilacus TaxID=1855895 RepID=UPI001BFD1BCB|nr:hypothetical protein [Polynucleobacter paludilacus]MBT8607819.1 hypothetical protein [Polynucleobacter paneuropaeus]QWD87265.1 hypothetical protein AOC06_01400 [Polynucleobacter paludilacus]